MNGLRHDEPVEQLRVQFSEGAIASKEIHFHGGKRSRNLLEAEHGENVHARVVVHLIAARWSRERFVQPNAGHLVRT